MALQLSGSLNLSGSIAAQTVTIINGGGNLVSSSQQIKDYFTFAQTSSANTFYGNQTFDTNTLFVDSVNHRIGIKTITPGRDVEINGDTTILGNNYVATNKFFQFEGGAYFTLRTQNSGNTLQFYRGDDLSVPMAININNGVNFVGAVTASNFKVPAGGGLDFSATSNGSGTTTSELLNDYEEGTFTPTLGGDSTYSTQFGNYTKIGNKVYFKIILIVNIIGTGDAQNIYGLPFTCDSTVVGYPIYVGAFQDLSTARVFMAGRVGASGTSIAIRSLGAAAVGVNAANVFQNGSTIEVAGFYGV